MLIKVRGEKIKITPSIDSYVKEKIGKLDKYFKEPDEICANVLVRIRGIEQIVEVTIPIKNALLRAEERNKDLYSTIDLVVDKLEGQIRKNKTKIQKKKNREVLPEINIDFKTNRKEEEKNKIVKEKFIETKPMSREEAILQMELLDHDFYIFKDDKSLTVNIVYKRKDGNYGIIETK